VEGKLTHVSENVFELEVSIFAGEFCGIHAEDAGEER